MVFLMQALVHRVLKPLIVRSWDKIPMKMAINNISECKWVILPILDYDGFDI